MPQLSRVPEIWPSPSQYRRPCQGTPYVHPATERNPEMYYDTFGYCDPTMSATVVQQVVQQATNWMQWVVIGGVVYLAWRYRKKLF